MLSVVSSGLPGPDYAALVVAKILRLPTGGFASSDSAVYGTLFESLPEFGLSLVGNADSADSYNADKADATVWFGDVQQRRWSGIEALCTVSSKPVLVNPKSPELLTEFIVSHNVKILNVAGVPESDAPGTYQYTYYFLMSALSGLPRNYGKGINANSNGKTEAFCGSCGTASSKAGVEGDY